MARPLARGEAYEVHDGRRLLWRRCADCGCNLGPAAAQYVSDRWPVAYAGKDGRILCPTCHMREQGTLETWLATMARSVEGVRV